MSGLVVSLDEVLLNLSKRDLAEISDAALQKGFRRVPLAGRGTQDSAVHVSLSSYSIVIEPAQKPAHRYRFRHQTDQIRQLGRAKKISINADQK